MKQRTLVFFLLPLLTFIIVVAIAFVQPWASHRATGAHAASTSSSLVTVTSCPTEAALIADIDTAGSGGTVRFSIGHPCTISIHPRLVIKQDLTLDNKGHQVTLDGGGSAQVLVVNPNVIFTLKGFTIANGHARDGGGLFANMKSTVHIVHSTFSKNSAQFGGGLFAESGSTVGISNSSFTSNSAQFGGGLFAHIGNTVEVSDSSFTNNAAQFGSGLLANANSRVNLSNSTFANDSAQFGGDLFANTGNTVNISNSTFTNDSAQFGAALLANANSTMRISNSTFTNNAAQFGSGLLANAGSKVSISNSTFANNAAQFASGLLAESGSIVGISNSTFASNSARFGGGLFAESGSTVSISNSTFANNSATSKSSASVNSLSTLKNGQKVTFGGDGLAQVIFTFNAPTTSTGRAGEGGGLFANAKSKVNISNSTFANNSAAFKGAGLFNSAGRLRIGQSIVANNTPGGDCFSLSSSITDTGYNLSSDTSCGFTAANHSLPNTNPQLDPAGLHNNGGPTQTIALLAGSPAIDQIPSAVCLVTTDQRGFPRPDDNESLCDIGAYESQ